MRIDRVTATAFGCLRDTALEFAPGFTLVFGCNESGKSTWHMATWAGLCGQRRGAQTREARDFRNRFRPWGDDRFSLGTDIVLADGRQIRLQHDLDGMVDCSAHDMSTGMVLSGDIVSDGSPDGSRFLGLDRRAFLATACVRQADITSVTAEPRLLQQHLQRAIATRGVDATAAAAIGIVKTFLSENVGRDIANSTRPLRRAKHELEQAREAVRCAKEQHQELLFREAASGSLDRTAKGLEDQVAQIELVIAGRRRRVLEQDLRKARELAERHASEPTTDVDGESVERARAAVATWRAAPEVPEHQNPSASALVRELQGLPDVGPGDGTPHTSVSKAVDALNASRTRSKTIDEARPPAVQVVEAGGLDSATLLGFARKLQESAPASPDAALVSQRDRLIAEIASRKRGSRWGLIAAGILAAGAIGTLLAGPMWIAVGIAVLALALLGAGVFAMSAAGEGRDRLRALEASMSREEAALGYWQEQRSATQKELLDRGLPAESDALIALAERLRGIELADAATESWRSRREDADRDALRCEEALARAFDAREARPSHDADGRLRTYIDDCDVRRRRSELETRMASSRSIEQLIGKRNEARAVLAASTRETGGDDTLVEEDQVDHLAQWIQEQGQAAERFRTEQAEWVELEALLRDRTVEDIEAELQRLPDAKDSVSEVRYGDLSDEAIGTLLSDSRTKLTRQQGQAAQIQGQITQLRRTSRSVPESEERLAAAEQEFARVQQVGRTLTLTQDLLEQAQEDAHRSIAPHLKAAIERDLPAITGGRYAEATVDLETLNVKVARSGGPPRAAMSLSHGTAEQIYLLLRVSLAEYLVPDDESCPLLLDEVTVQSDADRTRAILATLHRVSRERQVVLFTQEQDVLSWANDHLTDRDRLITLPRP